MVGAAHASVVITGTRVIFPGMEREVSVKLDNNGQQPALVQAWIDKGDIRAAPNAVETPFVIMPPVFRMEPAKGQTLRLIYTQEPLPQDRESVFWLNVLEIPPKSNTEADANLLQMAFRSRIKIFFRPKGLDAEGALDAPKHVAWRLIKAEHGGYAVEGSNPTPYHVNIATLQVRSGTHAFDAADGGMMSPGGSHVFALQGLSVQRSGALEFSYSFVNDYGSVIAEKAPLAIQ